MQSKYHTSLVRLLHRHVLSVLSCACLAFHLFPPKPFPPSVKFLVDVRVCVLVVRPLLKMCGLFLFWADFFFLWAVHN